MSTALTREGNLSLRRPKFRSLVARVWDEHRWPLRGHYLHNLYAFRCWFQRGPHNPRELILLFTGRGTATSNCNRVLAVMGLLRVEEELDFRSVTASSSGNCMAESLAQALVDHDPADHNPSLTGITSSIKRGIL